MRKTTACVSMSEENLEWLKAHGGISKNIDQTISVLRKNPELANAIAKESASGTDFLISDEAKKLLESERIEREVKIRAYFRDCPHIVYMAKTQRKFKKADLCKIKDELYYSKYNVDATTDDIRKVLKEEIDVFDTGAYEKERGILHKVK